MTHDKPAASSPCQPKCPICQKPPLVGYRPFCSKRCADIDLGRWVSGSYVIAGGDADSDEDGVPNVRETGPGTGENERGGE
jgi:uncharacterized protein